MAAGKGPLLPPTLGKEHFMNTRITELFGIKHPILSAAMGAVATEELVAAVSNAGGLGILPTGMMTLDEVRDAGRRMKDLTDKPWGISIVATIPKYWEYLEACLDAEPSVVVFALRSPDEAIKCVLDKKIMLVPIVGSVGAAVKVEKQGASAVIVEGYEGGGHVSGTGSIVIVPKAVDAVNIPVIAAGGYMNGRQMAAALTMGAEGIYMGSRFAMTKESGLHPKIKEFFQQAEEKNMIVTDRVTGMRARFIRNKKSEAYAKKNLNLPWNVLPLLIRMKKYFNVPYKELAKVALGMGGRNILTLGAGYMVLWDDAVQSQTYGDVEKRIFPIGQGCQLVTDLPTSAEVVERTIAEAEKYLKEAPGRVGV
ncbi:NAD(P)H-dependent flavin oxidoreductase [Chloroflexota bacterium]